MRHLSQGVIQGLLFYLTGGGAAQTEFYPKLVTWYLLSYNGDHHDYDQHPAHRPGKVKITFKSVLEKLKF